MTETAVEITGRHEISTHHYSDKRWTLTRFDGLTYLLTVNVSGAQFQIHLDQDDVGQVAALFARFAVNES